MSAIIAGTYNSRDTGGIPLTAGSSTRAGVLYRSDALAGTTGNGVDTLAASPIGTIVDFRSDLEKTGAPNRIGSAREFAVVELPLLQGSFTGMPSAAGLDEAAMRAAFARLPSLADIYVQMLGSAAETFAEVARLVARPSDETHGGVLVHCTAGKDRTGVAVALLLDAAGADRGAVIADYVLSETNLAGEWAELMLARLKAWGVPLIPAITDLVTATPPEAIKAAFAWLDERGGSAEYLRGGGLSDADLSALRERIAG
ncbi:protein-tyrosine phosphatase [Actinoplanes lutulentus]|uniref:Protein-tyrosine phosphatase n=1 Tax=Actinoplanes lutulentus TaxID=1287878 RepID=A0A327ZBY4_9ACTN|nr:tyrosine-protein phosphatase [Actinoplanes lutulentus]MBB2947190.1 protein-tyrosine phosphatase [Actinoplanes lutulentus]RAK36465.1 protein-tyrosine phosphatase [Actinoplanes lutulentus]